MKFTIRRTSIWDNKKPCKEAKSEEMTYVDRRMAKTLKEARLKRNACWATEWFASGENHREEDGMIARDLPKNKVWAIEIEDLQDLLKLHERYGIMIITSSDYKEAYGELEIYDDYRE